MHVNIDIWVIVHINGMELTILVITLICGLGAFKIIVALKEYLNNWRIIRKIPQGPPHNAYPFIGHSLVLRGAPDVIYSNVMRWEKGQIDHGHEVSHLWIGPIGTVSVIGPNAAEALLRSSDHIQKSFFYTFLHPWLGTGLLTADGEKWKTRRKLLTPTFHFSILQDYLEVMNEQASVFITKLGQFSKTGETFNMCNPVTLCALDIICETAMGKSIHAQENEDSEYVKAIYRCSELIQDRQRSPWLWWDFLYKYMRQGKEYISSVEILHAFTRAVIEDRLKSFDANTKHSNKKRLAFLDLLLSVSQGGKVLSFNDIQQEVDTFMFEGHDTTAAAMSWALHLIGKHPEIQQKIQEELDAVLGNDSNKTITMEDVRKLEYLEMVIKESLRIFPSVPAIGRITSSECRLDGHLIPRGTNCIIFPQLINNNVNFWSNPERFDPERFSTENSVGRHPYSYLPFSAGPRNCIGQRFALMEEKVMLAYLLRKFSVVSYDATEDLRLMSDLILRPGDGINVKISKREQ